MDHGLIPLHAATATEYGKKKKTNKKQQQKKKQRWCADYWTSEYMYVYSIEISCWNKVLNKRYSAWN